MPHRHWQCQQRCGSSCLGSLVEPRVEAAAHWAAGRCGAFNNAGELAGGQPTVGGPLLVGHRRGKGEIPRHRRQRPLPNDRGVILHVGRLSPAGATTTPNLTQRTCHDVTNMHDLPSFLVTNLSARAIRSEPMSASALPVRGRSSSHRRCSCYAEAMNRLALAAFGYPALTRGARSLVARERVRIAIHPL
jgi:hypothetical protein